MDERVWRVGMPCRDRPSADVGLAAPGVSITFPLGEKGRPPAGKVYAVDTSGSVLEFSWPFAAAERPNPEMRDRS